MKNILLISADFPYTYYQFARAFKNKGMNVFVIGGTPYNDLHDELKNNVTWYYQANNMENIDEMKSIINNIINNYGPIDFLESNNEYWLRQDAKLRETFNIKSGLYPVELDNFQKKSSMKKFFEKAGVKVVPYILIDNYENALKFAEKYGYPLFIKPDIGVGAEGNYKIKNIDDLHAFFEQKNEFITYICEVFVESESIVTFDGIADWNSNAVISMSMVCPPSIFDVKENNNDMSYYIKNSVDPYLEQYGKQVIKEMGLKGRFFHTEYFLVNKDRNGVYKKGDYIGIEINIRTPGGYTPDMQDFAMSIDIYDIYADIICFGKSNIVRREKYYCCNVSRRNNKQYFYTNEDIYRTFKNEICFSGVYPQILSDCLGDIFYIAKFNNLDDVNLFSKYVHKSIDSIGDNKISMKTLLGEDARIMREKNSDTSDTDLMTCDKNIDGA